MCGDEAETHGDPDRTILEMIYYRANFKYMNSIPDKEMSGARKYVP